MLSIGPKAMFPIQFTVDSRHQNAQNDHGYAANDKSQEDQNDTCT